MRLKPAHALAIPAALLAFLSGPLAGKDGYVERKPLNLAPVKTTEAVSVHSPFGTGDCSLCHKSKDPKKPGPAIKPVNDVCYFCHEDVQKLMTTGRYKHEVAEKDCTTCHNPHNSKFKQLLLAPTPGLCNDCHVGIKKKMDAKVKHDALTTGKSCVNCHSPHASDVEKVLLRLPFDQCIGCHATDDVKDSQGKVLTNFKKLLAENPIHHAPVAQKDCSSCHEPHGSDNTRLAIAE
jgi:predicted CXXCH cytochrome family protein